MFNIDLQYFVDYLVKTSFTVINTYFNFNLFFMPNEFTTSAVQCALFTVVVERSQECPPFCSFPR